MSTNRIVYRPYCLPLLGLSGILAAAAALADKPAGSAAGVPPAPAGHRYVSSAADVLRIAVGSSMVIDAVEDLVG